MIDLHQHSLLAIFLASIAAIVAAGEAGQIVGAHLANRARQAGGSSVWTLESAVLGLLALMIGFTFAMSLDRFEARRDAVLAEANAIGTTALRARLLPAPHDRASLERLKEYVTVRIDAATSRSIELETAVIRSGEIQEALWIEAMAAAAKDNAMVPTGLYIEALNGMIDAHANRVAAFNGRVPAVVVLGLYAIAMVGSAFAGFANGLESRRMRTPVIVIGILIAGVILMIQDLDRPGTGLIEVSQQPMLDTAASIAGYLD